MNPFEFSNVLNWLSNLSISPTPQPNGAAANHFLAISRGSEPPNGMSHFYSPPTTPFHPSLQLKLTMQETNKCIELKFLKFVENQKDSNSEEIKKKGKERDEEEMKNKRMEEKKNRNNQRNNSNISQSKEKNEVCIENSPKRNDSMDNQKDGPKQD